MDLTNKIYIYTDGASRGNPGISASGFAIYDSKGNIIKEEVVYNGIKTNNYAEYNAIILALEWCKNNLGTDLEIELTSDSELVIRQINGVYKVKEITLKPLYKKVIEVMQLFKYIKFQNTPRSNPKIAYVDKKLNLFLDNIESNIEKR